MTTRARNCALLVILLAGLGAVIAYNMRRAGQNAQPRQVTVLDMDGNWKCLECGHDFVGRVANGPRACPACKRDAAHVVERWACPTHRELLVALEYDGSGKPKRVRIGEREWISALDDEGDPVLRCPLCNEYLILPQALPPG